MGMFCQVYHIFDIETDKVAQGLNPVLSKHGYSLKDEISVDDATLEGLLDSSSAPAYIIGPKIGNWVPILDLHAEPWPGDICKALSKACSSYALCLMVHDDDVMFYNLNFKGENLDGYNSNPQFFETEKISDAEAESQRHSPDVFKPVLPAEKSIEDLTALLNTGWWKMYDEKKLDDDGVMPDDYMDSYPYLFEGARMADFGSFLELAGKTEYPFANIFEKGRINWSDYKLLQFEKKQGVLGKLFGKKEPEPKRKSPDDDMYEFLCELEEQGEIGIAFTEAASFGIKQFIEERLANGTNVDVKTPHGVTALGCAASAGEEKILDILLQHGADVNHLDDWHGGTALIGCVGALHSEKKYLSVCQKLIDAGTDLSLTNKEGKTAYDMAKEYRDSEKLLELLRVDKNG